jgi:hypothetical protein
MKSRIATPSRRGRLPLFRIEKVLPIGGMIKVLFYRYRGGGGVLVQGGKPADFTPEQFRVSHQDNDH